MVIGKLPNDLLEDIVFKYIRHRRKDVITGAAVGEDNAIVDFGDEVAILSTDPITGAANDIGSLAVNISCNDISTSGGEPIGLLMTILAPPDATYEDIEMVMKDAGETAAKLNVEIIGGHTEITDAVNKIVVSTTAIGKTNKKKLSKIGNIKVGDKVVVTKFIGIEGTSILLNDLEPYFIDKLSKNMIDKGKSYSSLISVVKEGKIGGEIGVNYMHDITEGGVLGAVWEAHRAIGKGIRIERESIPITDVTRSMSEILDIDPLRLISSGSMLMIMNDCQLGQLKDRFKKENIELTVIGEVIEEGIYMDNSGRLEMIQPPKADELYRALCRFNSLK